MEVNPDGPVAVPIRDHFGAGTQGLFQISDHADLPDHVLKIISPRAGDLHDIGPGVSPSPRAANYWAREACFYTDPGSCAGPGLRAPRPYAVEHRDDGTIGLRLEHVDGTAPRTPADHHAAAAALATFNAHHLRHPHTEPPPWLSRSWLRWWFLSTVPAVANTLQDPDLARLADITAIVDPTAARTLVTGLWTARTALLGRLAAIPRTLNHLDANQRNLLHTPDGDVVAVDWSYVGIEALGADPSQLFASTATRLLVPADALDEHYDAVLTGYLAGLRDAGLPDTLLRQVPDWFALHTCLRWGATHLFWLRHLTDPRRRQLLEQRWWHRPFGEAADDLAGSHRFFLRLADRCAR
ncbi:hypothetical protein AB0B66_08120 [Catellatospora sp. NPDC049111]|uniref:hypothetical protein n=1 Tax=Catellatospora sp. NPDC049111 TaxID=3155271 RepID=UPI0033E8CE53